MSATRGIDAMSGARLVCATGLDRNARSSIKNSRLGRETRQPCLTILRLLCVEMLPAATTPRRRVTADVPTVFRDVVRHTRLGVLDGLGQAARGLGSRTSKRALF